jgi:hypothetical protein
MSKPIKNDMKHTQKTPATLHAQCARCGKWFPIGQPLNDLIEEGIIHPLEINLCLDCAEIVQEEAVLDA